MPFVWIYISKTERIGKFIIYRPRIINNKDLLAQCELEDTHVKRKKKEKNRWNWISLVLRRDVSNIAKATV